MATATATKVKPLTPRQHQIYTWIFEFTKEYGYQPSYRDAAGKFGFKCQSVGLRATIIALARKGFVDHEFNVNARSRAISFRLTPRGRVFRGFVEKDGDGLIDVSPLTDRQWEVYEWIFSFTKDHGYQPSICEAVNHFGFTSPNGTACLLTSLCRKGWIFPTSAPKSRAIPFRVTPDGKPFCGFVER